MSRMAKKKKQSGFTHCKVTLTSHPKAPWRVAYPIEEDGRTVRRRKHFAHEAAAYAFAADHENEITNHGVRFGSITAEARRAYDFYRDKRADLAADGVELPPFETLVADAVTAICTAHADHLRSRITIAEAKEKYLAYKKTRVGERHLEGLEVHLRRFSATFGAIPMDAVTGDEIEEWLFSLKALRADDNGNRGMLGVNTRNKFRVTLKAFFSYGTAKGRLWLAHNPLADIGRETPRKTTPEAYTPGETAAILQTAIAMNSPILPALIIGFFAGMRPSEIERLDLETIDLDRVDFLVLGVKPDGTKTKSGSRMAPITEALRAWLTSQPRRIGKALPLSTEEQSTEWQAIRKAAGVRKIHDGARHSFISYRTAEIRDVARVADECGNSPTVIKESYREVVPQEAAAKYFAIRPADAENIITMEGTASA